LRVGVWRFKSSRPDHLKKGLTAIVVGPFLLRVTNALQKKTGLLDRYGL